MPGITLEMNMDMEDPSPAPGDELVGQSVMIASRPEPPPGTPQTTRSSTATSKASTASAPVENTARPGAYNATGRPVGGLPAWLRPSRRNNNNANNGGNAGWSSRWTSNRRNNNNNNTRRQRRRQQRDSQANLPPEMRTRRTSAFNWRASIFGSMTRGSIRESGPARNSSLTSGTGGGGRRRRSSIVQRISTIFAGDAVVQTAEQIGQIEEERMREEDAKNFKREAWGVAACLFLLVGIAVGISIPLTAKKKEEPVPLPSTEAPVASPAGESRQVIFLREFMRVFSSDPTVLEDPEKPQYRALYWLAEEDEAQLNPEDVHRLEARYALATVYFATNGNDWFEDLQFLSSAHECDWNANITSFEELESEQSQNGVSCNDDGEVIGLDLDDNNLQGSIPEELQALSRLQHLSFASNKFPSGRPKLDGVKSLNNVIQIGQGLVSLDASDNMFDALIPTALTTLSNLEVLHLENNQLKFTIPSEFTSLSKLEQFHLGGNARLIGNIENIVENMQSLEILSAEDCGFTISSDLRFPPTLMYLNIGGNTDTRNSNVLSTNIGRLSNLQSLSMAGMGLNGGVPVQLGLLTNLQMLELSRNERLRGTVPWSVLNPAVFRELLLERSSLGGQIPSEIGSFSALEVLNMDGNRLTGRIPDSIGDLTSLQILRVGSNVLTGPLPSSVGNLASLEILRVLFNLLTGTLPSEMSNMESLVSVEVQGNEFTGGDLEFVCAREDGKGKMFLRQNISCSCCEIVAPMDN